MIEGLKESRGAAFGFKVVGRVTADEVKAFGPQIEFIIAERKERPIGILADLRNWKVRIGKRVGTTRRLSQSTLHPGEPVEARIHGFSPSILDR